MADAVLIWGAGAIGASLGAYWARAEREVLLVDRDAEHVAACKDPGLRIEGPVEEFALQIPAVTPEQLSGRFSRIVLAVKAQHTIPALAALRPHLSDEGFVLSAQNGLNELEIARALGPERCMGAFLNFGADRLEPGRVLFGNRGAVVIGELDGQLRGRTEAMLELMQVFDRNAFLSDNIWGFLWGKLAYGAMLFASALNMDSMADNFADPERFVVWRSLAGEVMAVAAASGIRPLGFDGFDPSCFAPGASEAAARKSIADLAAFNRGSAKTHSGIWRDLAVHKKQTEVDAQIDVIGRIGAQVGVGTPVISKLVALVHDVECGRRAQSLPTFMELRAACN
ncbi:MAG: ketopantoate reductase family protein [Planctomycetota bacterium]|jgi:2-dehydropantoate 2-reductase